MSDWRDVSDVRSVFITERNHHTGQIRHCVRRYDMVKIWKEGPPPDWKGEKK